MIKYASSDGFQVPRRTTADCAEGRAQRIPGAEQLLRAVAAIQEGRFDGFSCYTRKQRMRTDMPTSQSLHSIQSNFNLHHISSPVHAAYLAMAEVCLGHPRTWPLVVANRLDKRGLNIAEQASLDRNMLENIIEHANPADTPQLVRFTLGLNPAFPSHASCCQSSIFSCCETVGAPKLLVRRACAK